MPERDPQELQPETDPLDEHPDVPEADYLEQHDELLPEYQKGPTIAADVPEADALDQAVDAGYDDEAIEEADIDERGLDDID